MDPTSEDDNEVVYVLGAVTYRVPKTGSARVIVETDYTHADNQAAGRPQTWEGIVALFAEA